MIKFNDLLKEIGNTNNPYNWSLGSDYVDLDRGKIVYGYNFRTEAGTRYKVDLALDTDGYVDISFKAKGYDDEYKAITNEGVIFRVISTVVDIVAHFNSDMLMEGLLGDYIIGYKFSGTGSGSESKKGRQRNKIYKQFLKRQFPNSDFRESQGVIYVDLL